MDKNILLIDDELINILVLEKNIDRLFPHRFGIFTANNGNEALDICRKEKIDLIFLDFMMPGIHGGEVAMVVKDNINEDLPIVLYSAFLINEIKTLFSDIYYFDEFLSKPVDSRELERIIHKYLF